ncbi:MAG TPA: hypothetical protein VFD01_20460 [Candidatus Dormibacteraeota bacterium]|jgi:hypothetical protein|nr:hypothetical protein [Candidatus Dormibacteraeota bacterium]
MRPGSELSFVALAGAVFVVCLGLQYLGYDRLLLRGLRSPELRERRRVLGRWLVFAVACEGLTIGAVIAYAVLVGRDHPQGMAWALPPIAALVGVSLPLQLAAARLARGALGQ